MARSRARAGVTGLVVALLLGGAAAPAEARPDAPGGDPDLTYDVPEAAPVDSEHFRVHYVDEGPHAATSAWAEQVAATLEQVWEHQHTTLGWAEPPPDGALGGDDRTDVYLGDILSRGLSGFVSPDPQTCDDERTSCAAWMALDNDYRFDGEEPFDGFSAGSMGLTAAHEYHHVLQYGLAGSLETWFAEASAVWMSRADFGDQPLGGNIDPTVPVDEDPSGGAGAQWLLWAVDQGSPDIVREAWERIPDEGGSAIAALDAALVASGTSTAASFTSFAAALAEWQTNGFPLTENVTAVNRPQFYPDLRRAGVLDGDTATVPLDHLTSALYDVPPSGSVSVTVEGSGAPGGLALVARTPRGPRVVLDATLGDGTATVSADDLSDAERLTVVVTNAGLTAASDGAVVEVSLTRSPPVAVAPLTRLDGGGATDPVGQAIAVSRELFADGTTDRVVLATADRFPDALAGAPLAGANAPILFTRGLGDLDARTGEEIARVTGGRGQVLVLGGAAAISEAAAAQARAAAGDRPCPAPLPTACRFAGAEREETAALVAQAVLDEQPFPTSWALVARSDDPADALTGGAFAAARSLPVVLTSSTTPSRHAVDFLGRNDIGIVTVLGGTAAVSDEVVAALPGEQVFRAQGPERTATTVAIATQLWSAGGELGGALLVNVRAPDSWQTALSAAPLSAARRLPQLGVEDPPGRVSDDVLGFLDALDGPVLAVGDPTLVSDEQLRQAAER